VDHREKIQSELQKLGIPTVVHYPKPLHLQPALRFLGVGEESFPVSELASKRVLSLPFHPYLKEEDQERVASTLESLVSKCSSGSIEISLSGGVYA
jgi:UDP-2-acetamido-2-deoxy-ribo-hexuluronate aminotransferase